MLVCTAFNVTAVECFDTYDVTQSLWTDVTLGELP